MWRGGDTSHAGCRPRGAALWCAILALMLTLLLEALDQTIVGTAMPRIIGQLHGLDRYTWTVSAYLLASTTLIPIAGKLSDQFGRKRFLLGGTALFLLGSVLCGSAQSIDQLIVFRAVQGAGGGIGIALVFTAVGDLVSPDERGTWQGIVGAVYAVSSVSGPTLGGWLADHGPLLRGLSRMPLAGAGSSTSTCPSVSLPRRRLRPSFRVAARAAGEWRDRPSILPERCWPPWQRYACSSDSPGAARVRHPGSSHG
jgi:MFS family permease